MQSMWQKYRLYFSAAARRRLRCGSSWCWSQLRVVRFVETTVKKFLILTNSEQEFHFSPSCRRVLEVSSSCIGSFRLTSLSKVLSSSRLCSDSHLFPQPVLVGALWDAAVGLSRQQLRALVLPCFLRLEVWQGSTWCLGGRLCDFGWRN